MENDDGLLTLCGWEQGDDEDERPISCSWVKASATKPTLLQSSNGPLVKTAAATPKKAFSSAALGGLQPQQQARYKLKSEKGFNDGAAASERLKQPRQHRMSMSSAVLRPTLFPEDSIAIGHQSIASVSPQAAAAPEPLVQIPNANFIDTTDVDASLTRCLTLPALPGNYLSSSLSRTSCRQEEPNRDQLPLCDSVEDVSQPVPELRQRKRGLIRHQSSNAYVPVSSWRAKPERTHNLRPMKPRTRVRVRDLLLDSINDDLSKGLEQLSLDPETNRSLWECEDEETCCSIYENSLGLVKVLTQFNTKRQETNSKRRSRARRTRQ